MSFSSAAEFAAEYERNIRHTGIEVETDIEIGPEDVLGLQLILPSGETIEVEGQLINMRGNHGWLALTVSPEAERQLAEEALEVVTGRAVFAPTKSTRRLKKPITGQVSLHDVAPRFGGRIVRAFGLDDLEDALMARSVRAASLAATTMVRLLRHVAARRLTGTLTVEGEPGRKHVYFFEGMPASVQSDPPRESERLGQILIKMGRLDESTLDRLLGVAREGGHRLGRVAVDAGVLDQEQLDSFLHYQGEVRLSDLLAWPEAAFSFEAGRNRALEEEAHPLLVHAFLVRHTHRFLQGLTLVDLEEALGVDLDRYPLLRGLPEDDLVLGTAQPALLERLIDPERTMRELVEASPLGKRPMLRTLLVLLACGAIEASDARGQRPAEASGPANGGT